METFFQIDAATRPNSRRPKADSIQTLTVSLPVSFMILDLFLIVAT